MGYRRYVLMPYYHLKCGGKIRLWSRKCSKCGYKWPLSALFIYPPPRNMTKFIVERKERKPVTYAKWADRYPLVNVVARALPNWPRWARILSVCLFLLVIVLLFIFITRGF